jgi:hypothetical protein
MRRQFGRDDKYAGCQGHKEEKETKKRDRSLDEDGKMVEETPTGGC